MKPETLAAAFATLLMILTSAPTLAQDAPFIGIVTKKEVDIRSGTSKAYYAVGSLKKGDMVRVEKTLFNKTWYQIRVPKGVHSYVSKVFINAQGDGKTGTVNTDRTAYKAASLRGPGESYREQGLLAKDDIVTILAEEGNYYKIESPKDTFVFIPTGTLRQATAEDLEAATDETKTTDAPKATDQAQATDKPETPVEPVKTIQPVKPVAPSDTAKTVDPVDPVTLEEREADNPAPAEPSKNIDEPKTRDDSQANDNPKPTGASAKPVSPASVLTDGWPKAPSVEVKTPARSEALQALEMKVLPYFSLPIEEQPLGKMAEAYQTIRSKGLSNLDQQIVDVRLRVIKKRQQIANTMERAKQARKKTEAHTVIPKKEDLKPLPDRFTAVGTLVPSTVYDGDSLPLLYRIVDASPAARTLAYVAPNEDLDIGVMLNQLVGIVGQTRYDRTLKLNIIEIQRAVMLEPETKDTPKPATPNVTKTEPPKSSS